MSMNRKDYIHADFDFESDNPEYLHRVIHSLFDFLHDLEMAHSDDDQDKLYCLLRGKKSEALSQKQVLLNNVAELDKFADQLLMMEEYQDRLNGSNMKESLEGIRNIVEESLL